MAKLEKRKEQEELEAQERTRKFFETKSYQGIPVPSKKQENKDKFGQNTEDKLVEWEKNQIKDLWFSIDKEKKGLRKEDLVKIMGALMKDQCIIGKVPNLLESEIEGLFDAWPISDEKLCQYTFFREGLNTWVWKMQDRETLQQMVDEFFALSLKFKMQGKEDKSKEMATKALRLEGSLTKCKPIEIMAKADKGLPKRGDFLIIKQHRRVAQDPEALLPNDNFDDFTKTHKF